MLDGMRQGGLWERVPCQLPLKLAMAVVLPIAFCVPFFSIEYFPLFPARQLRPTQLDLWLGHDTRWVWAYVSLYLYMPIVPLLLVQRSHLLRWTAGMIGMSAVAFVVFLIYPTAAARPSPQGTQLVYQWLVTVDRPSNAVPSLHCAFAVYTALSAEVALHAFRPTWRWRTAMWVWCTLICASTMLTKQHMLIDAVAGAFLGLAGFPFAWRNVTAQTHPQLLPVSEPS